MPVPDGISACSFPASEDPDSHSPTQPDPFSPLSMPSLTFKGVGKDEFLSLQQSDPTLEPLWEDAHVHFKRFSS